MIKINRIILSIVAVLSISFLPTTIAYAATCGDGTAAGEAQCSINAGETGSTTTSKTNESTVLETVNTIINIMLFIIGIISVIMIIWGGISYVTSAGAADKTKKARDTIIYSLVGLVVAMVSWALVSWVFSSLSKNSTSSTPLTEAECQKKGSKWHLDASAKKCVENP